MPRRFSSNPSSVRMLRPLAAVAGLMSLSTLAWPPNSARRRYGQAAARHYRRTGADEPPDGQRAVSGRPQRRRGAVRARQRVLRAVLAAGHAGPATAVPAAGDRPAWLR